MKLFLKILAALGGGLLGRHIFQHPSGGFVGVGVGWLLAYFILSFPKYLKADPKSLLAFHQNNDFSKMFTVAELESIKSRLAKGGLLKMRDNQEFFCSVDKGLWETLNMAEKLAFCCLCYESCIKINGKDLIGNYCVYAHTHDFVTSSNRELLNAYIPAKGLLSQNEFKAIY